MVQRASPGSEVGTGFLEGAGTGLMVTCSAPGHRPFSLGRACCHSGCSGSGCSARGLLSSGAGVASCGSEGEASPTATVPASGAGAFEAQGPHFEFQSNTAHAPSAARASQGFQGHVRTGGMERSGPSALPAAASSASATCAAVPLLRLEFLGAAGVRAPRRLADIRAPPPWRSWTRCKRRPAPAESGARPAPRSGRCRPGSPWPARAWPCP